MEEKENLDQIESAENQNAETEIVENKVAEDAGDSQTSGAEVKEQTVETVVEEKPKKEKKEKKAEVAEEPVDEFAGLTDDEIYTKLQTQKLVRKRRNKRIVTSVFMGIAFVLALVVILSATVPVHLNPRCITDDFISIEFYPNGSTGIQNKIYSDDEGYDDFVNAYKNSFKQTYLTALFKGDLTSYEIEEHYNSDYKSKLSDEFGNSNYVVLTYDEEKVLKTQSGKTYISEYKNSAFDGVLTFTKVCLEIKDASNEGFQETKILIPVEGYASAQEKNMTYYVTITVRANTSEIGKIWNELVKA